MRRSVSRQSPRVPDRSAARPRRRGPGRERPRVRREPRPVAPTARPLGRGRGGPAAPGGREEPRRLPAGPLEIVFVGWEWPPGHTGGLGVHCYELSKEIARLGHRITFLSPFSGPFAPVAGVSFRHPGESAPDGGAGEPLRPYAPAGPGSPGALEGVEAYNAWVAALSFERAPDVVHVHDWFGTVGAALLARRLRRPLVTTIHSTEYDRSLGHPWPFVVDREQRGVDAATRVIAVSQHLRQQLIDRYRADPERVRVIYNAVRPSERLAQIDPSRRMVLYLGRLAAMKGVDTFLRAAARVVPSFPEVLFVIAGEGPEYGRLIELAARLGIGDRVMFLGKVTDDEREILLAGSSVFVLPSVVEPFGIAALEAMAAGVPTIVSKTSGVAEISSGTFRVDFWDVDEFASRIAELLEYPELRRAMGARGRWEALRAGWPERALETVGLYGEAMTASPPDEPPR